MRRRGRTPEQEIREALEAERLLAHLAVDASSSVLPR